MSDRTRLSSRSRLLWRKARYKNHPFGGAALHPMHDGYRIELVDGDDLPTPQDPWPES
jgi:hypothetical protein